MNFYNNIFAATYKYYSRFKSESPRVSAICLVTISQIVLFILVMQLLKMAGVADIMGLLPNKYYFLPVYVLWLFLQFKFYNSNRTIDVMTKFEQKTLPERKIWGILSIVCFIGPMIVLAFLLMR